MRTLLLMCSLLLAFNAQGAERPIVQKGSDIVFTFTQMNVPVQGRFTKFSGILNVDAAKPEASSVNMTVDVASISAGEETDAEAGKPEWLSAKLFPQATFVSKSVKSLGAGHYVATGTFTLKGLARELVVPFEFKEIAGGTANITGQFSLKRGDYKIGEGEWSAFDVVANDVLVRFHLIVGAATQK